MPVREALKDLAAEGLVEHVPYRGVRVREFTVQDILDLYACRSFKEGLAARYAAESMTADEFSELRRLFEELQRHPADEDVLRHRDLHRRFHQLIYAASRHAYLIRSLDQMWAAFPTMMLANFAKTARQPLGRGAAAMAEHAGIMAAVEARDPDRAEALMRQHIEATAAIISTALKTRQ
jgi:DNA-binding GntR family transcriptional regulator